MAKQREKVDDSLPSGFNPRSGSFPSIWEPEPGDTLTGRITEYKTIPTRTKAGESDVFTVIEDKTNLAWSVFISAGLKGRVSKKDVKKRIFIRRMQDLPARKKGRNPMKQYIVGVSGK